MNAKKLNVLLLSKYGVRPEMVTSEQFRWVDRWWNPVNGADEVRAKSRADYTVEEWEEMAKAAAVHELWWRNSRKRRDSELVAEHLLSWKNNRPGTNDRSVAEMRMMLLLARRMNERGTRPSRTKRPRRRWESLSNHVRDWRMVAYRWLRRYIGGDWYVGGHHVGRPHGAHILGERLTERRDGRHYNVEVGGIRTEIYYLP